MADQPVALGIVGIGLGARHGAAGDQPLQGVIAEVAVGGGGFGDLGDRADGVVAVGEDGSTNELLALT